MALDSVATADGRQARREVVFHRGSVGILALDGDDLLLVRQYRYPTGEFLLEIPAGRLEEGEDPRDCARRELEEETGFSPVSLKKVWEFWLTPGYSSEKMTLFLASSVIRASPCGDPDEDTRLVRTPVSDVPGLLRAGKVEDAKTLVALTALVGGLLPVGGE